MKTSRNCLYHSKPSGTRFIWNDGNHILWSHICKLVNDDQDNGLKLAPRLSQQHISLNPYSVMNVCLAVQTLSSTTAMALRNYDTESYRTGYDENTIRMQKSVVPVTGNTKGGFKGKRRPSWSVVDETPLKKCYKDIP